MNKNSFVLSVNNPCSEKWDSMAVTSHGAFCQHCQKEVIDFSSFSDKQIIEFFNTPKESVCGKLKNNQLQRVIRLPNTNSASQASYYKLFFGLFISTFWNASALVKSNNNAFNKTTTFLTENNILKNGNYEIEKDSLIKIIKGKVLDKETNEPIPFASIFIRETNQNSSSDLDGNFKIVISNDYKKETITLKITYVGYEPLETKNVSITSFEKESVYSLILNKSFTNGSTTTGEVVVLATETPKKKKWWQRKSKQ